MINFDAEKHLYTLHGKDIPSVTRFLKEAGFCPPSNFYTEVKRNLGTKVHDYTALIDRGYMCTDDAEDEVRGYLKAWEAFCQNTSFKSEAIETIVWSEGLWLAGTIDRFGHIGTDEVIIDIKTGRKADWHRYQLAAYNLIRDSKATRVNVYLTADGKYTVQTWGDVTDYIRVLQALESRKPA